MSMKHSFHHVTASPDRTTSPDRTMAESDSFLDRQRERDECETKGCWVLLLVLVIITTLVFLIFWEPEKAELRVDSVFTSGFNLTGPYFSGDWNVGFTVTANEKRKSTLSFDNLVCSVMYYDRLLGVKYQKAALVLGAGNQTAVNASVVAESTVIDEWTWAHMTAERSRGNVSFTVLFDAFGGVDSLCFTCRDLVVNFGSTNTGVGELVGGSRNCSSNSCPCQSLVEVNHHPKVR